MAEVDLSEDVYEAVYRKGWEDCLAVVKSWAGENISYLVNGKYGGYTGAELVTIEEEEAVAVGTITIGGGV